MITITYMDIRRKGKSTFGMNRGILKVGFMTMKTAVEHHIVYLITGIYTQLHHVTENSNVNFVGKNVKDVLEFCIWIAMKLMGEKD